ncbi:LemA family protein [Sporosarcina sp. Marseille-Q4063]|uniref:LemA family protein n=1 Tax=Sporosarcina sp. Marseille-Q4063 TaxID=2810514 RepID=UPI001BB0380B|nr:LemA family protein [Sporosarcina sp. Marseille-Q4063]QUW22900.1 LemA family protein [Sporosarcina sp. Marseille-Q4063]
METILGLFMLMLVLSFFVVAIILIYLVVQYNTFISLRNRIEEAHRAIETYLLQRFDQLSKLADTVVSYTDYEQETQMKLAKIRTNYTQMSANEKLAASNEIESFESKLKLQVENYPELKADTVYRSLTAAITDVEEKLSASRRSYNANVYQFNTKLKQFPTRMIGSYMKLHEVEMLEVSEENKVDFNLKERLGGV